MDYCVWSWKKKIDTKQKISAKSYVLKEPHLTNRDRIYFDSSRRAFGISLGFHSGREPLFCRGWWLLKFWNDYFPKQGPLRFIKFKAFSRSSDAGKSISWWANTWLWTKFWSKVFYLINSHHWRGKRLCLQYICFVISRGGGGWRREERKKERDWPNGKVWQMKQVGRKNIWLNASKRTVVLFRRHWWQISIFLSEFNLKKEED